MQKIIVSEKEAGQQLMKLLSKYLTKAPQSFFYKMLRKKNITLNGKKAEGKEKTVPGDCICLFVADDTIRLFGGEVLLEEVITEVMTETGSTELKSHAPIQPSAKKLEERTERIAASAGVPSGFSVVYEDADILLMNKPAGLLTQKAAPQDVSLNEKMIAYLLANGSLTERELKTFRPAVCNRLDRNTSGLVAAGKTIAGLQFLSEAFRTRTLDKFYECIVTGELDKTVELDGYLKKDAKKNKVQLISKDYYRTLANPSDYARIYTIARPVACSHGMTLLEVELITGKTHQIRAHLASIGHPILGDTKYGTSEAAERLRKQYSVKHQLLHAGRIEFKDCPERFAYLNGQSYSAPRPAIFEKVLRQLEMK